MRKSDLETLSEKFESIGLTTYQSRALATLLILKEAKAIEIANISSIPKARIYQILEELMNIGLVRKKPARPAIYRSLDPEKMMKNLMKYKRKRLVEVINLLKEESKEIFKILERYEHEKTTPTRPIFEILSGGEVSESETRRIYRSSRNNLKIISGVFEYLPHVIDELIDARKRGVKVKVILKKNVKDKRSKIIQNDVISKLKDIAEIRMASDTPLRGTIGDESICILSVDEGKVIPFEKEVVISENPGLVRAMNHYFDLLWENP